jgi:hypothetical protein
MVRSYWIASVGVAVIACATSIGAQVRFEALTREPVAGAPGLEVVTIRDQALMVCYTVFVIDGAPPGQIAPSEPATFDDAVAQRDRRLSDLSSEFERSLSTAVPGTLGPNVLKFEWEGQKAQSDYERALRERELARLEARLIVGARKLAVTGPSPCLGQPSPSRGDPK